MKLRKAIARTGLTITGMRRLLNKVLPTDADLNAFCLDAFADSSPELFQRVTSLHDRKEKVTLLLTLLSDDLHEVLEALDRMHPEQTMRYRSLLDAPEPAPISGAPVLQTTDEKSGRPKDGVRQRQQAHWPQVLVAAAALVGLLLAGLFLLRSKQRQAQAELDKAMHILSLAEEDLRARRWSAAVARAESTQSLHDLPAAVQNRADDIRQDALREQHEQGLFESYVARTEPPSADDSALLGYREISRSSVYYLDAEQQFKRQALRREKSYLLAAESARQKGLCDVHKTAVERVLALLPESLAAQEAQDRACPPAPLDAAPPQTAGSLAAAPAKAARAAIPQAKSDEQVQVNGAEEVSELGYSEASRLLKEAQAAIRQGNDKAGLSAALAATRAENYGLVQEAWEQVFLVACKGRNRKLLRQSYEQIPAHRRRTLLLETACLEKVGDDYLIREELQMQTARK